MDGDFGMLESGSRDLYQNLGQGESDFGMLDSGSWELNQTLGHGSVLGPLQCPGMSSDRKTYLSPCLVGVLGQINALEPAL